MSKQKHLCVLWWPSVSNRESDIRNALLQRKDNMQIISLWISIRDIVFVLDFQVQEQFQYIYGTILCFHFVCYLSKFFVLQFLFLNLPCWALRLYGLSKFEVIYCPFWILLLVFTCFSFFLIYGFIVGV